MSPDHKPDPPLQKISDARQKFIQRLAALPIKPAAHEYYVRWAEAWTKARGHQSAERTQAYFDALGRSAHIADWQFRQAVDAARILACDVLNLPWAATYDWQRLSDQSQTLESTHRPPARESIPVVATSKREAILPASPPPETDPTAEHARIIDSLRSSVRLAGLANNTEEAYLHWSGRFIRFCFQALGQHPATAGPPAIA